MIYFSGWTLFGLCVLTFSILIVLIHYIWIHKHLHYKLPPFHKLVISSCVTGILSGFFVFLFLSFIIPSVDIIYNDSNQDSKFFLSKSWNSQMTKNHIYNLSNEDLVLMTICYGASKGAVRTTRIANGEFVESGSISGFNVKPPQSIRTRSVAEIRRYLFTEKYYEDNRHIMFMPWFK